MTLNTPSLHLIPAFDATSDYTVEFTYSDNQPIRNRAVITDVNTDRIVYDQMQDTMRLQHIIPSNTLTNGKPYLIQIQVFDADENSSNLSEAVLFYCFSQPGFHFANVENGDIYKNADLQLLLDYSQPEEEKLKSFRFFLYSFDKSLLHSSDTFYSMDNTTYTFYKLENNKTYYVRATGETVHGMALDTGYIEINISYFTIPSNLLFEPTNHYHDGYIQLDSNIISIGYELENQNYRIEDGCLILEDNSLTYNDGFHIDGDYILMVEAKKLPLKTFLKVPGASLSIVKVCTSYYCRLTVDGSALSYYCPLPKPRIGTEELLYILDDSGQKIETENSHYDCDDFIVFEVKRMNGYYALDAYYKSEKLMNKQGEDI